MFETRFELKSSLTVRKTRQGSQSRLKVGSKARRK